VVECTFQDQSLDFHVSRETVFSGPSGFPIAKGSWLGLEIDPIILHLQHAGLIEFITQK
jgi:hypothetical protein